MYNLSHFKETDLAVVKQFMKDNAFALLVGADAGNQPVATQVPLLVEERADKLFLLGHVQRKTDHQLAFEQNPQALAVFTGAHTYISASWYTNPQVASTWNYMAVHAKGRLQFLGNDALLNILQRTTALFENNKQSPALVEKMPEAYLDKMMKAIIGFEMEVTHLDNVFKLSQNRDRENFTTIIEKLEAQGGQPAAVAAEMKQRKEDLFGM